MESPGHLGLAHGNCCASKAVGWRVGVARNADLVVVPMSLDEAGILLALSAVVKDILRNRLQRKAVVSYSISSTS